VPDQLLSALVNLGTLGPVVAAVGLYVLKLQREHREDRALLLAQLQTLSEKRTLDAHAVVDRVLGVSEAHSRSDEQFSGALQTLGHELADVRQELRDMRGPVRR
jgi:hypothetical protein